MHCWSPPTPPTRKVSLIKDRTDVKALCDACGRSFGAKKCSKCHAAAYCSISCQREAWSNHKGPCKRIGELNAELRAAIREMIGPGSTEEEFLQSSQVKEGKFRWYHIRGYHKDGVYY